MRSSAYGANNDISKGTDAGARMKQGVRDAHVQVGTCGFAAAQATLFREFDILEVQQTFYQPPGVSTVTRWREHAPPDFIFTIKAWQLLTHEPGSPTYRRLKEDLGSARLAQAASFKWNDVTRMA